MAVIRDVANLCGLSVSVVSKYLNHPESVREDTRQRVEAAIKELNYVPSTAARSMRTNRTGMIAILVPDIRDEFHADLFNAVKHAAMQRGYTPILYTIENDLDTLHDYLGRMAINHFDGLIPCFLNEEGLLSEYDKVQERLPVVMMGGIAANSEEASYSRVAIDVAWGAYQATRHLIEQGYKRIAFIGGPEGMHMTDVKFDGYKKAIQEAGMEVREDYLCYGKYRYQTGEEAAEHYLTLDERPDAVFASNDAIAAGLMKRIMRAGIHIPREFGVVGFDNVPLAEVYEPGISTIDVPLHDMCKEAVDLLVNKIEGANNKRTTSIFEIRLLTRESSRHHKK